MIRKYPKIAKNYFQSWFLLDFISTFPFDALISGGGNFTDISTLRTIKLVRILKLFRLIKLFRLLRAHPKLQDAKVSDNVHPSLYQMTGLFTYIFFVAHILACAYYYIADCEHYPEDQTAWMQCGHRHNPSSQYLTSLYFIMTTIFGVGYGDILITTVRGRLFSIFVMFVGSITFGFVVATVSECVESWNPKITARKLKMDEMLDYCNEREMKPPLKIAILRHFDYFYNKSSIFSEKSILQSMPILLHQSVLEHSRENCLNHLNLFQKEEHSTLTYILPHLKPACMEPNEIFIIENDYLVDMLFIMRGTIHATLQNDISANRMVLVGIFGPGSDFGCSNALFCNTLSWATYRATVLTDVMWLGYQHLQDSTGRMKELFQTRANEEIKNQKEVLQYVSKSEEVGSLRVPSFILCDGQVISCRHAIRMLGGDEMTDSDAKSTISTKVYKTVYMRGYDHNGKPNFVEDQETTLQMRLRYVINPHAKYKLRFDFIVAIFALFSTITIPLRLGFHLPSNLAWNIVDLVTEILFFIDLLVSFFTAYEQSDYSLNTIHSFIARRYIKSWFLIDLLSSIPFYRLSRAARSLQALVVCKVFRVIRIFRLASFGKLFRFINTQENISLNSEMIALRDGVNRIIYSVGFVALFTHLCACFWSWLELSATGQTWATEADIERRQYVTRYVAAIYWSYTTLATVGYGDIVAGNDGERLYTILIFGTGSTLLAYVVGLVRAYAFNRNGSNSFQEEKLNLVRHYLTEQGISKSLKEVIMKHYTYYIEHKTPYNEMEIWIDLPHHLRQEAIMASYAKEYKQLSSFLSHFKNSVYTMLLNYLEPAVAQRGSYIYTFETGCDGMYFILDGVAEIIDEDDVTLKEVIVAQIRKGMLFGHEILLGLSTDFLGVRALTPLRMLFLRARHLQHIKKYFPLLYSGLINAIHETLRPPPAIVVPPTTDENKVTDSGGGGGGSGVGRGPAGGAAVARGGRGGGGIIELPDQAKLAEFLKNRPSRGFSRQQSSIEEAVEWFAGDMDELLPTERGGLLMGEVYNPNCPSGILSLNSKDQYKAMKDAAKLVQQTRQLNRLNENSSDESNSDDDSNEEEEAIAARLGGGGAMAGEGQREGEGEGTKDKEQQADGGKDLIKPLPNEPKKPFHEVVENKFIKLFKSGKKHYAKIQINFHPRRAAVERKYRMRSLHEESSNESKASGSQEHLSPLISHRSNGGGSGSGVTDSIMPAPLREENSYHFDASSDSD